MKIRFPLFVALALSFIAFTNLASSQTNSQTILECESAPLPKSAADESGYKYSRGTYIWSYDANKNRILVEIDRIVPSESQMIFTFVPKSTVIRKNEKLELEVFPFGRETDFGGTHIQNPLALKTLKLPPIPEYRELMKTDKDFKKSQLSEEQYQSLNWDRTALEKMTDTGEWYAIFYEKNALNGKDQFIRPVENIANYVNQSAPTQLIPPTLIYNKGELVELHDKDGKLIKQDDTPLPDIRALKVIKFNQGDNLTDKRKLIFDTTGLELGKEYWVVLQGTAVFKDQTVKQCSKTTTPVLIGIKPEITLDQPKMVKFKADDQVEVTATIKARAPFELKWAAEPNNHQGIDLSNCPNNSGNSYVTQKGDGLYEARCLVKTIHNYLKQGDRIPITARVVEENKLSASCRDESKCTEIIVNHLPKLTLNPKADCKSGTVSITATASDVDVPTQTLRFSDWKIYEGEDNYKKDIPLSSLNYEYIPNSENAQSLKISGGLQLGVKYTFSATVYDGYDKTTAYEATTIICPKSPAGTFYFGLATPDYRKNVIITNPEEWTADTEPGNRRNYSNEGRKYPREEVQSFYDFFSFTPPKIDEDKNNTVTLNRMVQAIKTNPSYKLYVYGYADYKATGNYDNCELSRWRIRNVVYALEKQLPGRIISGEVRDRAFGDNAAQTRDDPNTWSEKRRQDRRVEVLYVLDPEKTNTSEYQNSKDCFKGSKKKANLRNSKPPASKKSKHKGARK